MQSIYKGNKNKIIGQTLLHLFFGMFPFIILLLDNISIFGYVLCCLLLLFVIRRIVGFIVQSSYIIKIDYETNTIELNNFSSHKTLSFYDIQEVYFDRDKSHRIDYVSFYKDHEKNNKSIGSVPIYLLSDEDINKLHKELKDINKDYKISSSSVINKKFKKDDIEEDYETFDE